ncbi:solute carrier family 22 member 14 [Phyllostomus hastatus]|uniref:solute carrier family 22 member 14 n=1 Tax=Phyllostomus hastatus TaxID=9423 RepID=UPI001E684C63|nr:solute carrier family 22 member 14 [Phyllostomus hastatus]
MADEDNLGAELKSPDYSKSSVQHDSAEFSTSSSVESLLHSLRVIKTNKDDKFDSIMNALGGFGTFQQRLVALTSFPYILLAFFTFTDIFTFTAQEPYCNTSWILAVGPNLSEEEQLNLTLPRDTNGNFMPCLMYMPVTWDLDSIIKFGLNYTQSCYNGWIYPHSKTRSIINEFDLVCEEEMASDIMKTIFLAGLMIGSILFGLIGDRIGRYPSILLSILGMIIFGFGTAFVNSFQQYLFFRFGTFQASTGYYINSVALTTEWLTNEYRAHSVILNHCLFSLGIMFLTGLAYNLPHWRLLFLLGGAPAFSFISFIWILPESPRWLMVRGKVETAKQVLCYAASVNKKTIPLRRLDKLQVPEKNIRHASILNLYNNKNLCKITLVTGYVWFTISHSYFIMGFRMKDFGLSFHISHMIPRLIEVPAQLCSIFLLKLMGRKGSLVVTVFHNIFMNLLMLLFPSGRGGSKLRWSRCLATESKPFKALIVLLGKFSQAISVAVFFIYTAELFPTVLRSTGLGLVFLAWVPGGILSVALISQNLITISSSLFCIFTICALLLCLTLPETCDWPLSDYPDDCSTRDRATNGRATVSSTASPALLDTLAHSMQSNFCSILSGSSDPTWISLFSNKNQDLVSKDMSVGEESEEVAENTILNKMMNEDPEETKDKQED